MAQSDDVVASLVAPIVGFVLANVMFFSSLPELRRYDLSSTWGPLNAHPYPIVVANCIAWMMYGAVVHDYWVFASNVPGAMVSTYATLLAIRTLPRDNDETNVAHHRKKGKDVEKMFVWGTCGATSVVGFLVGVVLHDDQKTKRVVAGAYCNAVLATYYASPLSEMKEMLTRRDAASLYWPMSAAITVNGFSWAAYGFASNDWFLFSPNAFGGVVGVVQLVFLATFSKEKKQKKTRGTDGMEMEQRGGGGGGGDVIVANLSSEDLILSGQPSSSS